MIAKVGGGLPCETYGPDGDVQGGGSFSNELIAPDSEPQGLFARASRVICERIALARVAAVGLA
jgi:hypothetical protein